MPSLTTEQARALAAKRVRHGSRNARKMIIDVQQLLLKDIKNPKVSAAVRAKCAIALDKLEDRLRILNGKPLPTKGSNKERKRSGPAPLPMPEVPPASSSDAA